jgi:hypothetical protein
MDLACRNHSIGTKQIPGIFSQCYLIKKKGNVCSVDRLAFLSHWGLVAARGKQLSSGRS